MPCSHCQGSGHNIQTCPNISEEERKKIKEEKKKKKLEAEQRRILVAERYRQQQELLKKKREEELKKMATYEVINDTQHELAVYWAVNDADDFTHFTYVPNNSSKEIRCYKEKHQLCLVHVLDVVSNSYVNDVPKHIKIAKQSPGVNILFRENMKNYSGDIIFIDKPFVPKKSELDRWKESSLKANFLLQEIIKMGGKSYENLEPMLDMVEDIKIPEHTDYDKELAGIPSNLTNIT